MRRASAAIGAQDLASVRYAALPWGSRDAALVRRDMSDELSATPHGVLKAAQRNPARLEASRVVTFVEGATRAKLYLNAQFLLERVELQTRDATTVAQYWDYRELGTIKFPMRMRQAVGDVEVLDIEVREVEPNYRASGR